MNKRDNRIEVFVREYLKDLNGTRAAIAAGYAEKSAHVTATRLLRKAKVRELVSTLQRRRFEELDISADRVLDELARMGFANMRDYIKTTATGDAFVDLSKLTRDQAAAIQEITVDQYMEGKGDEAREVKRTRFKLADKRGSLELLGRHLKLFTDRVEHSADDELLNALAAGRKRVAEQ